MSREKRPPAQAGRELPGGEPGGDARAETGVSGLDQILGGGLPLHRMYLIEGYTLFHPSEMTQTGLVGQRTGSASA